MSNLSSNQHNVDNTGDCLPECWCHEIERLTAELSAIKARCEELHALGTCIAHRGAIETTAVKDPTDCAHEGCRNLGNHWSSGKGWCAIHRPACGLQIECANSNWVCTLPAGHTGQHEAWGTSKLHHTWTS